MRYTIAWFVFAISALVYLFTDFQTAFNVFLFLIGFIGLIMLDAILQYWFEKRGNK